MTPGCFRAPSPLIFLDVASPPLDKAAVAQVLRDMGLLLQLKGENAFKSRAYELGADRIASLTEDLSGLVASGRLQELPGIGEALAQKIAELVTTGRLAAYEALRSEFPDGVLELLKLPDLGPKKVAALVQLLKIGTVAELEAACREGRVRALKGFGQKTEERLLAGIEGARRGQGSSRPLGEVLPQAEALLALVQRAPGVQRASIAGSVRRRKELVSDVDLIASASDVEPVFDALVQAPGVAAVLGRGDSKCSVRLAERDLQVDLRVLPDAEFATALHHFTGSRGHHVRLRGLAQEVFGLKISEWGVHRKDGTQLVVREEADLYALLGMQFIPPELREDAGEIEAARAGLLPKDLVSVEDVQGIVHSHSTWSDGRNSLEEMAKAARALGVKYLTVTEHSEAAIYAGGLKPDDLQRQWDEIDQVNEAVPGIRLLKGIEVDILESGALDYRDSLLEKLEVVIGSVHVRHSMDEEQMTRRVLEALENPFLDILGHPTGRLLAQRDPYPLHMERVLDRAAERGKVVEVNGNPRRLDLKAEHVRQAVERGVKLVVSCDSHSVEDLQNLPYAVGNARRGWAKKSDVLNTLGAAEFVEALRAE